MNGDKSKSRKRERETATSICALVPGGGLGYDAVKALVNHGRKYFSEKEIHLLELCRYVVLNPVRAGVVHKKCAESDNSRSTCEVWLYLEGSIRASECSLHDSQQGH